MENNQTGYTSYHNMVAKVSGGLKTMEEICGKLELSELKESLEKNRSKLSEHKFAVGIMGEFKRGKSTVINSLLEAEIIPADILPCSATMNRVTYGNTPSAMLVMNDGSTKSISVENLKDYVTKIDDESASRAEEIDEAIVYYPCRFCKNEVDIIDTPGLNDDERMNKITENVIPKLDAVIMVVTHDSPFSMSESEFVRSKLMTSDLGRLIFLVNKMDTIRRKEDRERVLDGIREKINKSVMDKMKNIYGADSDEYKQALEKLGEIKIYPYSALDALEGRLDGDEELVKKSGIIEFETALTKMLTVDRDALEIKVPLGVLAKAAGEVTRTINTRIGALQMSAEEFEKQEKEALSQIDNIRKEKREENDRLTKKAASVRQEFLPMAAQFYPDLRSKLKDTVDAIPFDLKALANDAGKKAAAEKIRTVIEKTATEEMSYFTEKILEKLQEVVEAEAVSVGKFTHAMELKLGEVNDKFDKVNALGLGADIITDFIGIYGIGGIISGYREGGIKGALVGGGAGLAANLLAAGALASLSIVGLPMVVISCAIGSVVGKHVTRKLFPNAAGERNLEKIKENAYKAIDDMVTDMQSEQQLEKWIRENVSGKFDELKDYLDKECEALLTDTQKAIEQIKIDIAQNEVQRENTEKRYKELLSKVNAITEEMKPVGEILGRTLGNM